MQQTLFSQTAELAVKKLMPMREFKMKLEREYLIGMLRRFKGNQCHTAREIGVHRNTLSRMLAERKIDARQVRREFGVEFARKLGGIRRPTRREEIA